jgi:hypothetical protein
MSQIVQYLDSTAVAAMSFGAFKNKSYFGYSSGVLKSGICKYFRREKWARFEWCCIEMLLFGIQSKALVTNLVNRLYILLMEEICCNSPNLVDALLLLNSVKEETDILRSIGKLKRFCDVVSDSKKGRICSYVNNWWKHNPIEMDLDSVVLDKVLPYQKKGDSEKLLKIGEQMIHFIEQNDQKIIGCFQAMYGAEEAAGARYRRKDGVYLYWEIIENYLCTDDNTKLLFQYGLEMFHRKSMKERRAFGVWIGLLALNRADLKFTRDAFDVETIYLNAGEYLDVGEYLQTRTRIEINEDYVVNDWHVNKQFGKEKFAKVGSHVENECRDLLGDSFDTYKQLYIQKKTEEDTKQEKTKTKKKRKPDDDGVAWVTDFHKKFKLETIIHEGVCGMKKPCLIVEDLDDNHKYVLKEMSANLQHGLDYMFMDSLKHEFGLVDLEMERFKSNVGIVLKDKAIRQYKENCELGEVSVPVYFCKMKFRANRGDLVKQKGVMENLEVKREMLRIRLFDGLFRSSDNNLRNILVGQDNRLISIDEGDIFGKRGAIFAKNDWCKKDQWCKENISDVIQKDIFATGRKERIVKQLEEYKYPSEIVRSFETRYDNYVDIVLEEFQI